MALQARNTGTSERAPMMEFTLSDREFKFLSDLFYDKTGIVLGDAKRDMVYSRLTRRIRTLGLSGFSDYCDLLQGPQSDSELNHAINAITTNLTKFFRESHHFDFIRDTVVPKLFAGPATRSRRIRFWSAGCSSGMEPYSLAMTLLEACRRSRNGIAKSWQPISMTICWPLARRATTRMSKQSVCSNP